MAREKQGYRSTAHTRRGAITTFGSRTDVGCVRDHNEDSLVVAPPLFVVADGMGGHKGGEVASTSARDNLLRELEGKTPSVAALSGAIEEVNRQIYHQQEHDDALTGMGTTLSVLWMSDNFVYIGHVGDSRVYLLRDGEFKQMTLDHSLVEQLVREGVLTEEEAQNHPMRNIITRAIGTDESVEVDVVVEERRAWRGCSEQTTLSSASGKAPVSLTNGQQQALAQIERARLDAHGDVVLVDGVTGSGKTEVYLSAIERVLAAGRSACVLVPEISLTAQTVGRFRSRFGETVAVFHSRLSAGERLDQWDMVASGTARVVVGARSALFCPLSDLGLIIIDEEHETSYKQGSSPRYHAREVAAEMARRYRCPLVLGSATPSAEALDRCRRGTYNGATWTRVEMPERPGLAVLPTVRIADLRREFSHGSRSMFSKPLMEGLERVVERREKAVLLHNRRGFAPFLMCRECGCVPTCNHCSTALTYHERTHTLQCHTCGSSWRVQPYPAPTSRCPKCGSRYLAKMGLGTQQIEDALHQMLPEDVAIIRMDADSTRGKDSHKKLLEQFDAADCAVLLGTQMIAKGLDFPEVTLVGVVNADFALKLPDFRAGERAYDLLEQVAGRAGRGDRPGEVIVQTYLPEDPVIRAVAEHDRSIFTDYDLDQRRDALYPPFVRLVNILVWSANRDDAQDYIGRIAKLLKRRWHAAAPDFLRAGSAVPQVLGPASCVIERAKDRYRFHLLVKSPVGYHVSDDIDACLKEVGSVRGVSVSVDVDAYDLM